MGAAIGAEAISHLEEVSDEGVRAMATSGSVAVVLPTTAYILRLKSPPVRKMIEAGVIVALGSDFNPNACCLAMVSQGPPYLTSRRISHGIFCICVSKCVFSKRMVKHAAIFYESYLLWFR